MMTPRLACTLTAALLVPLTRPGLAQIHTFEFCLDGEQVLPPTATGARGQFVVLVDDVTGALQIDGTFDDLATGSVVAVHLHGPATVGEVGPILEPLAVLPGMGGASGSASLSTTVDPITIQDILVGFAYIDVHATSSPGTPELRGQVSGPVGTRYCTAAPNSAGAGATVRALGLTDAAQRFLDLEVEGAPPQVAGLWYFGPRQIQTPFGDGLRCVGGPTSRVQPPGVTDATGAARRRLDFASPYGARLVPGASLNFQFWYPDAAAMGSRHNLSDAVNVVFH